MKKLIFDCDNTMGVEGCDVDDGLALLYLLGRNNSDIIGITTTYGNSDIETVYSNTCRVVNDLGISIPVIKGSEDKNTLDSPAARFIVESINANKNNNLDIGHRIPSQTSTEPTEWTIQFLKKYPKEF